MNDYRGQLPSDFFEWSKCLCHFLNGSQYAHVMDGYSTYSLYIRMNGHSQMFEFGNLCRSFIRQLSIARQPFVLMSELQTCQTTNDKNTKIVFHCQSFLINRSYLFFPVIILSMFFYVFFNLNSSTYNRSKTKSVYLPKFKFMILYEFSSNQYDDTASFLFSFQTYIPIGHKCALGLNSLSN